MTNIQNKPVLLTDTTLRDGQQSLIATRLGINEILPIVEKLDKIGFHSLEVWGGATFDACLRFLNEDPWERLRKIREAAPKTKLQMLLRGQNILGYRSYADDVVESFVRKSIENGIDILRIFDALNDIRNLETAVKATKKENGHAQLCICYTLSDIHNIGYFVALAKSLENIGADSICIKDMAGLLLPYEAEKLVGALKENTSLPIQLHSHYTSGVASMTYMKAVEAGVDIIDTAMSPFALGTSQPSTEVMAAAFQNTPFDPHLDQEALNQITAMLRPIRQKALDSGLLDTKVLSVDINTLVYQVPGGMLSNLVSQLKEQNAEHKFDEVLKEVPLVRADLGYPPLVTPTSQIVGTQAVINVITGERYKMVTKETKDLVRGKYGKTPMPIDQAVIKKIIGDEDIIITRPADLLSEELPEAEKNIRFYKEQEEDVLTYVLFPAVAENFFKERQAKQFKIDSDLVDFEEKTYPV